MKKWKEKKMRLEGESSKLLDESEPKKKNETIDEQNMDMIEQLQLQETDFEDKINEIMTTIKTQESENKVEEIDMYEMNMQRTKREIDEYWIRKYTEFDRVVNERNTHIHREIDEQTKIVRDITDETIRVIDEKVKDESTEIIQKLTTNIKEENIRNMEANEEEWKVLKNEMRAVNTQLVQTNSTAIKNCRILENKLSKATQYMEKQAKEIDELTSLTNELEKRSTEVNKVLKSLKDITTKDCVEEVKNNLRKTIEKYITTYITEAGKQSLTIVRAEVSETEIRVTDLKSNMKIMQDSVKELENNSNLRAVESRLENCNNEIESIEIRLEGITDEYDNKKKNINELAGEYKDRKTPPYKPTVQLEEETDGDKTYERGNATFMGKNTIDIGGTGIYPPILTPFQFLYPKDNHHAREVESHKFQKTKLAVTCTSEDSIFTFYNTLRHIAASYNILLRPLKEITKETGICQITKENSIGYDAAQETMATALHMKLTTNNYFKEFPAAQTYVRAASNDSDTFKLMYRILEIIHPQLRASKGGIHKTIKAPSYDEIEDDSIYTFINRYKNYLLYEMLSTEKRQYNKQEQTMYVVNALKKDVRFKEGIEYVLAAVLTYQRDSRAEPLIMYPIDLEIDEIAVTIDDRSEEYNVGDQEEVGVKKQRYINPYGNTSTINVARGRVPYKKPYEKKGYEKGGNQYGSTRTHNIRDNSITCKACNGIGHCATREDTICYALAKTHMCTRFLQDENNKQIVRENTHRYRKQLKERMRKKKVDNRLNNVIKKMVDEGQTQQEIDPIVKLAIAMDLQSSSNEDSESDNDNDSQQSQDS